MTIVCLTCNQPFDVPVTPQQLAAWRGGMLIQKAMPNLNAAERELLISQTCGACFDAELSDPDVPPWDSD